MFDAAVINSYITYTTIHGAKVHSHREFRLRLARGLVNGYTSKKRQSISFKNKKGGNFGVPDEIRLRNVGLHMPIKDGTYKRCRFCSSKEKEKRTNVKCCHCNISLCAQACFKSFHFAAAQSEVSFSLRSPSLGLGKSCAMVPPFARLKAAITSFMLLGYLYNKQKT